MTPRRWLAAALAVQVALVAWTALPRLIPRLTGEEYRILVEPVDPIDPFRGAYVALDYPGLPSVEDLSGTVFVPLEPVAGTDLWRGGTARREPPPVGPYLRCKADGWRLRCGIESLFASQARARRLEQQLTEGAVARVRVDGRGNAAVSDVLPAP